jgi:hypothetical protein
VATIQLGERQEVKAGDQGAGPAGERRQVEMQRRRAGEEVIPVGPRKDRVAQRDLVAGEFDEVARLVKPAE